ncbi:MULTISPECIES: urea amidolyase associated protein UAAP1 [Aeribacillus]|jgi:urea carboxylase-associated protein 2|uniref:Urea carboxylase n=1 Tax=Aeribacillus pallidus TaxID=33936 RepID=A0A223E4P1_9BACI|nr:MULTISPECIES: urea amidolyase associated protein UAAP1 [Aeribacillus]ASS90161.1 urea carboxylase [Aeribacillus pallidus]TVZ79930.1 hypothetical protein FB379_12133 [Aeribacillus composti]BBU38339.1 urea carboxylase [Aeribacillus pallidus]
MTKIFSKTIVPGGKWSGKIGKGKLIRFTALESGANLSLMMYHVHDLSERYNMPDTLKAQHTFHLTKGNVLMSDNGRVLASITSDSLGWHDTVSGYTTREGTDEKYGKTSYQELRNDWLRSGEENFAMELVRNGLSLRDMAPVVNLFSKVKTDDKGNLTYCLDHCKKNDTVTLRTEMDILLIVSNTPNPLDPRTNYPSVPVAMEMLPAEPVDLNDYCVNYRPENRRAFENTWEYYALL